MVDLQSKYRLFSYGYCGIVPRCFLPTLKELKHECGRKIFASRNDRPVHDCRIDAAKWLSVSHTWEAWLLSHGLRQTYKDVAILQHRQKNKKSSTYERDNKLLCHVGVRGVEEGNFLYPRGLCCTVESDIIVADSLNHRVQVLSRCGLFKMAFGTYGSGDGEFNEPSAVTQLMPSGKLLVSDRRNKRLQVFSIDGCYLSQISTDHQPYSLASNRHGIVALSTLRRTVHIYHMLELTSSFPVPTDRHRSSFTVLTSTQPLYVAIGGAHRQLVVVSDPADNLVKLYNFDGTLLHRFQPRSSHIGLVFLPAHLCVTALGRLIIFDRLNRVVNMYTDTGQLVRTLLLPSDGVGSVGALCVGPEGHMVTSESSISGEHCVKIFRYRDCCCHRGQALSSRM